jgi:hypothetical protein
MTPSKSNGIEIVMGGLARCDVLSGALSKRARGCACMRW